jgi:hypothetical protein
MQLRLHQGTLKFCWQSPDQGMIFHDIGPAIDASYMSDETTRGFTGHHDRNGLRRLLPA